MLVRTWALWWYMYFNLLLALLRPSIAAVPCAASKRIFNRSRLVRLEGYRILRCIGEGLSNDVWSMKRSEKVVALKILKPSRLGFAGEIKNRSKSNLAAHLAIECLKGQVLNAHRPDVFVNCYKHGTVSISSHLLPYTIHQLAVGYSLKQWATSEKHYFYGRMLPKLIDVLRLLLRIWDLRSTAGFLPIKQIHNDLHWGNILVGNTGRRKSDVMLVDYSKHTLCVEQGQSHTHTYLKKIFDTSPHAKLVLPDCSDEDKQLLHESALVFPMILPLIIFGIGYLDEVHCVDQHFSLRQAGFPDVNRFCKLASHFFQIELKENYYLSLRMAFKQLDHNLSKALSLRVRYQYAADWERSGLQHLFAHIRKDMLGGVQDFFGHDPQFIHFIRQAVVNLT